MKKIFLLGLLCIINTVFSQNLKADLVFKDGDIIEGFGVITKNNKIKFRVSLEDKPEVFTGKTVKTIIIYSYEEVVFFEYVNITDWIRPVLLKVISHGEVNLYERKENYIVSPENENYRRYTVKRILYLKRDDENFATKIGFNFKKQAKEYFKDCDIIQELLESREYKRLSKEEIVEQYNVFCTE